MSEQRPDNADHLTLMQDIALSGLCERYHVAYDPQHYQHHPIDGLPDGWVSGWVGGPDVQKEHPTIYIGCSPEGRISS